MKFPADTPKTVAELSDEPGTRATELAVLYLYPRIPVATRLRVQGILVDPVVDGGVTLLR